MPSLTIGILGLDRIGFGHREQGIEAVDDFLGSLGLIVPVEYPLLGFLDSCRRLNLSRIKGRNMSLVAPEDSHCPLIIGIPTLVVTHAAFSLATRHVARLKFRIFLQDGGEILDSFTELPCAHMQQGAVIKRHEVGRIALEHIVKVGDRLVVVSHLGTKQAPVEVSLNTGGFQTQGIIIIGHRTKVVIEIILHKSTVDEIAGKTRLKQDGTVHIGQGVLKVTIGARGNLGTHDICRSVVLVQFNTLVQVLESDNCILASQVHLGQADVGSVIATVK